MDSAVERAVSLEISSKRFGRQFFETILVSLRKIAEMPESPVHGDVRDGSRAILRIAEFVPETRESDSPSAISAAAIDQKPCAAE